MNPSGSKDPVFELCDRVRETAFAIHNFLRGGHLEKVYENALVHRLTKAGIRVDQQVRLEVRDIDGTLLGEFFADLIVDGYLLVELKACRTLAPEHIAQVLGYLRACELQHALLINFGSSKLEIKKLVWDASRH